MKRRQAGAAIRVAVLITAAIGVGCASPHLPPLPPGVRTAGCAGAATPASITERVHNATGGVINIKNGHRLTVPAGALPYDSADFHIVVPQDKEVQVTITARQVNGAPFHQFSAEVELVMSYYGRGCIYPTGTAPDTMSLDIYRVTQPPEKMPKVAAADSTITTRTLRLSTFAIAH